jgi:hypothetical protein
LIFRCDSCDWRYRCSFTITDRRGTIVADFVEMTEGADRRWCIRTPTRIEAWADPVGATHAVECFIADLSEGGARLASVTGAPFPNAFTLRVDEKRESVEVIWRAKEAVGVRFR